MHNFHLRDDYLSKRIADDIHYISRALNNPVAERVPQFHVVETNRNTYCKVCFNSMMKGLSIPLDCRNFDLLKEWYLEVLLDIQIVLTSLFINKISLRQADNRTSYLISKLSRLYSLLESGLALHNKNFFGIIQQLNTEELIVNYHAISTVFGIPSQNGVTNSLSYASDCRREQMLTKHTLRHFSRNTHLSTSLARIMKMTSLPNWSVSEIVCQFSILTI